MNLELLTELQTVKEELTFNEALPSIFGGKDVTGFPVLVDTELSEQEAKQLSDRLKLKNQKLHADFERLQTKLKPLPHNLAKKTVGKHVFPLAFTHSWKSPRSKYLWRLLQERVLGPDRALIQDEEEMEKSPGKVNSSIINQGFKHFKTIKRNFEIICFAANPKNSHPTEGVDTKRNLIKDTNDDEDFYEEVAVQNRSSAISLILVDSQRSLATWNISEGSSNLPTQTLQLDHEVNSLVYLSKYQSFAALTGLFTVKVNHLSDNSFSIQI